MKKIFIIPIFSILQLSAQAFQNEVRPHAGYQNKPNAHAPMSADKMRELREIKENMIISDLNISPNIQPQFRTIFNDYQESQRAIREKFKPDFNARELSDAEAEKKLNESFFLGQSLLDNRKKFAEKFRKILTPQQVLQLFQSEGKMRNKMMDRRPPNEGGFPPVGKP